MPKINLKKLLLAIATCQIAGLIGAIATISSVKTWYPTLVKPWFTPPSWVFGPAWTILYTLMGLSFYIIWQSQATRKTHSQAIRVFIIQLAVNVIWSIVFFGLKNPSLSLLVIIALWAFILATIIKFAPISKLAAWLLAPYLAWVSFASLLNFSITFLNP